MFPQFATAKLGDRTITRKIDSEMSDAEVQALFAQDYQDEGYSRTGRVIDQSVQNPWQLSNYKPSLTENLQTRLGDYWGGTRDAHRRAKKAFRFVNDVTPVGNATGMDEGGAMFRNGLQRGHLGQMGLGAGIFALSASPIPGAVRRPVKGMFGNKVRNLIANEDGAIRAWHGSPHDFDRFDMSKIGTGEGAQAYGHGLYFAENPEVAREYQRQLSRYGTLNIDGANVSINDMPNGATKAAARILLSKGDKADAIYSARVLDDSAYLGATQEDVIREIQRLADGGARPTGRLYEVNINAEPEDFLDWDAPLSGHVNERLAAVPQRPNWIMARNDVAGSSAPFRLFDDVAGESRGVSAGEAEQFFNPTGKAAWDSIVARSPGWSNAAQSMRDAGIPGIKYLDQGSRGAGDGTRNYVVFDDSLIDILNKY